MQFRMTPGPFQRSKDSTKRIMQELFCVLCAVWLFAIIFTFIKAGGSYGLRAILIGVISLATTIAVDVITALIYKKKGKEILDYVLSSFSYITAIIFALTLPAGTSYFAVIVGSLVATLFGKVVFGGFGANPCNPAAVGRVFVAMSFSLAVPKIPGLVDATTGATVTGAFNYLTGELPSFVNFGDLFLGNYMGAMGETCSLLLLVAAGYMIFRRIIDYRPLLAYIVSIYVITFFIALLVGIANPFGYALNNVLIGGVLFGGVFMLTDPVSGPTNPYAKLIYGLGAAFFTVLIRLCGSMPEGCVFSILLMNFVSPVIESACKGKTTDTPLKKWLILVGLLIVAIFLVFGAMALGGVI